MPATRVFLIDDSPPFLEAAASFLNSLPNVVVVGQAGSAAEAFKHYEECAPDVVLATLDLAGRNGLSLPVQIKALPRPPRVIILSDHEEPPYRARAKAAHADDFVLKREFCTRIPSLLQPDIAGPAPESDPKGPVSPAEQPCGDLTELNTVRVILGSVGKDLLADLARDSLETLGTSAAVYEKNGDYALGIRTANWCRLLDTASRSLCPTADNAEAIASGQWHCHESCRKVALTCIETGQPVDRPCLGGINVHAVPVRDGEEVIGSIQFGHGDPPADAEKLQEVADRYGLSVDTLRRTAASCRSCPPVVIDRAKKRLATGAQVIGEIVQRKRAEASLEQRDRLAALSAEVSLALTRAESVRDLLQQLMESLVRHLDAAFARVWTVNASGDVLELQASAGLYTHLDGAHRRIPMGRFKIGRIAATRQPHLTNDVLNDPWISTPEWARREGMVAFAGYPLLVGDQLLGVMAVFARQPLTDFALEGLGHIADMVALGIERKRTQEALAQSEKRLRTFITRAQDVIFDLCPEGKFLTLNPAFEKVTGWPVAQCLGQPFLSLVHPHEVDKAQVLIQRVLAGESPPRFEIRLQSKDGRVLTSEITATPRVENERIVGVSGIARDITDRKRLEEQFRQAQKMEAVGRLAGGVAHDFNNLLTVVNGYSEILLAGLGPGHPLRAALETIHHAGERGALLTRQLLAFSRKQVLQPTLLELNVLLADAKRMLERLIGEDVELTISPAPDLWKVTGDMGQIEQVVMNLVVNARDAMPTGGQLTIETRNVVLDETYRATRPEVRPGEYVLLAISDTGCGMDSGIRSRIFEPFFTTKGPEKGTGLGLATVFGIVRQSNGHIAVYSEPDQGTTFKIYLPRTKGESLSDRSSLKSKTAPRGHETILLAEDEDDLRALTRFILLQHGYQVLEARHGGEALEICEQHEGPIHLLASDVVMPNLSGRQLAERLCAIRPEMKVLYLSGYTDDAVVRHGVLEADMPFLQKPFAPGALARKVREVLDDLP